MRLLLAKYLKRIGTFYQITATKEYRDLLTQQTEDTIDEDEDMFIPFVSIPRAERISDLVHYVIEVNSGSKNYEVKRTFKHFAILDETVCCLESHAVRTLMLSPLVASFASRSSFTTFSEQA
jgi:hypothetical protein